MNPEKTTIENEQLEKNEVESQLPEYKTVTFTPAHLLSNEEQDEIWNEADGYAE